MKRTLTVILYRLFGLLIAGAMLSSLSFSIDSAAAQSVNLVPNPSFEVGGGFPDNWFTFHSTPGGASFAWEVDPYLAHSGSRSVCIRDIQADSDASWESYPPVPVQPGAKYKLSGWALGNIGQNTDSGVYLSVFPLDSNGQYLVGQGIQFFDLNSEYFTQTDFEATMPANAASVRFALEVLYRGDFHPGVEVCFDDVAFEQVATYPGIRYYIRPRQYHTAPVIIATDTGWAEFTLRWYGSDIVMSLTTPSGRIIDRSTVASDVIHELGSNFESYKIQYPEPGEWVVEFFGADVPEEGEDAYFEQIILPNEAPTADAGGPYSAIEGGSVTLTASGSDPEGGSLSFAWDLDNNGSFETPGQSVVFSTAALVAPSTHLVSVQVTDGGGLTAVDQTTVSVLFNFAGFFSPIDNPPVFNMATAGNAIPVKFSLHGDHGLNIFTTGSPASQPVACDSTAPVDSIEETITPGSNVLSYDPVSDQYIYVWKTVKLWKSTCRKLIVTLADGNVQTAYFRFK